MSTLNAMTIQEALKAVRVIHIPWLQHTFAISYTEAKRMMAELERRGWVVRSADRRYWRVHPSRLCLRRLDVSETDTLCENVTLDCVSALECLREARGKGLTRKQLEHAVHGATDTEEAIRALTRLNLIYYHGGLYYSRIPRRDNFALTTAVRRYTYSGNARGHRDGKAEAEDFRRILWETYNGYKDGDEEEEDD